MGYIDLISYLQLHANLGIFKIFIMFLKGQCVKNPNRKNIKLHLSILIQFYLEKNIYGSFIIIQKIYSSRNILEA